MLKPTKYQLKSALGLLVTGIKNKYVAEKVAVYQFEFEKPVFSPPDAESVSSRNPLIATFYKSNRFVILIKL